jgi:hypothetical protein
MEAKDFHATPAPGKNLLDKIASDPDIINRAADEPAAVITDAVPAPEVTGVGNEGLMGAGNKAPVFNLLDPRSLGAPAPKAAPAAAPGSPDAAAGPGAVKKRGHKPVIILVLLVLLSGGGAAAYYFLKPAPQVAVATPTPKPTASATPSPTPTATPTPTPTPTPTATPVPENVTAPAAAPTADHPQAVKVTSPSGLWLRSSPNSSNQKNVIGWMPNGSTVSVDSTGSFWWHGTYNGRAGYFAVNYTK